MCVCFVKAAVIKSGSGEERKNEDKLEQNVNDAPGALRIF